MRKALVSLAVLVGACSTPIPPASDGEKSAALQAFQQCLLQKAREMDDGRSDATTVALAIRPYCRSYYTRWLGLSLQDSSPAVQQQTYRQFENRDIQSAREIVMMGRRRKS